MPSHRHAAISGVGQTEFSSSSGRSTVRLAYEAISAAARDAGISTSQIDGIVPFPMGPTSEDLMPLLGTVDVRFTAVPHLGGASSTAGLRLAALAVENGTAENVAVFVARNGRSGERIDQRVRQLTGQLYRQQLEYVHGMNTPAQWYSLLCRRHMHEFGTTREALGTVALTMRRHAQLNEHAQMHGRELTWEQYLSAPVIADPYLRYDCCLETDGAAAVIVSSVARARDAVHAPVRIASVVEGHPDSADDLANRRDFFNTGLTKAAPRGFGIAGLTPADVDVALVYDCFTFEVIQQLEEAGFCDRGEGGPFVTEGNIALDGSLPVNPHGGLLSEGHVAGMNHVVEAVHQLRNGCGARQVPGARVAAVTGWGDLGDGALALLTSD
ncbi:transporter [Pseudonocardia sp. C8]|uniref:thiolase C-terminal domain-containing protein n=1 Tax=Pseudonocardia sp. C8 TaxID=2762759 RepID=UPI001643440F|nr:transporter [Pseudonocardia sp. C8]MBC3192972.1 transporter [Pseudonocardia sp. C8]